MTSRLTVTARAYEHGRNPITEDYIGIIDVHGEIYEIFVPEELSQNNTHRERAITSGLSKAIEAFRVGGFLPKTINVDFEGQ